MTIDERFAVWAAAQSEACKLALLEGRAAVQPIRPDNIIHGTGETFASAPSETIMRVSPRLSERLDRAVP